MPDLELLAATDVSAGRVCGPGSTADPMTQALAWQAGGARWVHLVDLDAAFGRGTNAPLLAEIVGRLDVHVELAGGIGDQRSLEAALATGCRRVVLSTLALQRPDWCVRAVAEHGDRVAVGLDVRGRTLAARGSESEGGNIFEALAWLDAVGAARYVVTDVARDGSLGGPNLELLAAVCAVTARPVVASGGVATLADLRALSDLGPPGLEGVVVGSALWAEEFTLPEALAALSGAVA